MDPLNAPEHIAPRPPDGTDARLSSEQWLLVKAAFHDALDRPLEQRESFIREACQGDAAIETVLRSLLASDRSAEDFLETPAVARVGLPPGHTVLRPGERLGAYEIVALLGAGGMGEVYRAHDHRLARDVALKVLRADVMHDLGHRDRLELEARATAALDHPNVCPIFEIGEHDGLVWIAMQYVEGETLAARLRAGPLELSAALDVTAQIAHALSAAHARGIVHRDVKPENIMIAMTGHAKMLDFGLASVTDQGRRAGTLPYMSPEQLRGEPLDGRTDVYSLCVVIFEALTGTRPFSAGAVDDLEQEILSAAPPALPDLAPAVPPELARVVRKGLEKDAARRHQTMLALAEDLAVVRRRLEVASSRRPSRSATVAAAVLTLLAVAGALWWLSQGTSIGPLDYTRLTSFPDFVHSPALSPDGTHLAFIRGAELYSTVGRSELYVKSLADDGRAVALTDDGLQKSAPTFSPDGASIIYSAGDSSFTIPITGGAPTLFRRHATGLRLIGRGALLFSEVTTSPNMRIVTATEAGESVREIYRPSSAQGMARLSERSPDGRQILVVEMDRALRLPCRVLPFDGSSPGRQVGPAEGECTSAAWSPDGQWMYFSAGVKGESHLWRQRVPDGAPEQITFGPNEHQGVVVDPDRRSLITSVVAAQSAVWYRDQRVTRPISVEGYAYQPLVAPNAGRVFYLVRGTAARSLAQGELWAFDLATARNERILTTFPVRSYQVSPDGTQLVFDGLDREEHSRVWLMRLDRKEPPRQLTPAGGADESRPFFGKSGRIYFQQERSPGVYSFNRMEPDGSGRHLISESGVLYLVNISPDEQWAVSWDNGRVSLFPIQGGASVPLCGCGRGPIFPDSPSVAWSRDGKWIYFKGGKGSLAIPWQGLATLHAVAGPPRTRWEKLPGVQDIAEFSIAPGPTSAMYAFVRQSRQSNLFRIQLPVGARP